MMKILALSLLIIGALFSAPRAALELGEAVPDFTLEDIHGESHRLADYLEADKIVVLEWFNPDCPFIVKHHSKFKTMNETFAAVAESDVVWLAVNSGAPGKQGHGLERNREAYEEYEMSFPVLLDETGEVGRAYGAKTTPHMFVIAADGKLVYQGAIDSDPSPKKAGEKNYVAAALAALQSGDELAEPQTRPYGCGVKYGH